MAITVVGRWQVPAGKEQAAIAAARRALEVRTSQPAARHGARVFQAIDDPRMLLHVGEWTDRSAFER